MIIFDKMATIEEKNIMFLTFVSITKVRFYSLMIVFEVLLYTYKLDWIQNLSSFLKYLATYLPNQHSQFPPTPLVWNQ